MGVLHLIEAPFFIVVSIFTPPFQTSHKDLLLTRQLSGLHTSDNRQLITEN